jgi:hypothetical protein
VIDGLHCAEDDAVRDLNQAPTLCGFNGRVPLSCG